jgi:starch synthase (maltosyl-transferring)
MKLVQPATDDSRLKADDRRLTTVEGRVIVEHLRPEVDGGRFPIKRTVGERVVVIADIFADGHDVIAAVVRDRHLTGDRDRSWREAPMTLVAPGTDEWRGDFEVSALGWHEYEVVAWIDRFLTWRRDLQLKAAAGQDVSLELVEGSLLVRETAERVGVEQLLEFADALTDRSSLADRVEVAADDDLTRLMARHADRARATVSARRTVWVDRERARFGAWYELFPRSTGVDPDRSGTFREDRRPRVRRALSPADPSDRPQLSQRTEQRARRRTRRSRKSLGDRI